MTGTFKTTCPYPHGTHPVYTRSSESSRLLFFYLQCSPFILFPDEEVRGNTGERERIKLTGSFPAVGLRGKGTGFMGVKRQT